MVWGLVMAIGVGTYEMDIRLAVWSRQEKT